MESDAFIHNVVQGTERYREIHYIIIIIIICVIITRARCSRAVVVRLISYDMCVSYYNIHSPHVAVAVVAHANRIAAAAVFIIIIFTPVAGS
jgi:uncharacterized MnhB-related membrane protein